MSYWNQLNTILVLAISFTEMDQVWAFHHKVFLANNLPLVQDLEQVYQ